MEGGPPIFRQDCTCPALLEDTSSGFPYGAVTRYGSPFQALPVPKTHATGLFRVRSPLLTEFPVVALATTEGVASNARLCLFLRLLRCFSSPGLPHDPMNSDRDTPCGVGCPIRRSRDHRSLASPPGFSQRATSFIASQCQGIHQMPLLALDPRRFRKETAV